MEISDTKENKSDKLAKNMAMNKEDYLKIGTKGVGEDKKITHEEVKMD